MTEKLCPECFTPIPLDDPNAIEIVTNRLTGEVIETREYFICDCGAINIRVMTRKGDFTELELLDIQPQNPILN